MYKTVNIYKFDKNFLKNTYVPFLKQYIDANGKGAYYEMALKDLVALGNELDGLIFRGKWYEIDTQQDLAAATKLFA